MAKAKPVPFSVEIAERVCDELAKGKSLRSICERDGFPDRSAVHWWRKQHQEFADLFDAAWEIGCHALADECLAIADDGSNDWMETLDREGKANGWKLNGEAANRSRLRIETRMKLLAKWLPKVYGDKVEVSVPGAFEQRIAGLVPQQ